jgi:hypothetical protein
MGKQRKQSLTQRQKNFLKAFEVTAGNVSNACEKVNISRAIYYHWLKTNETFKEKVEEVNNKNIDFAETMLLKNIREGKESSIFFFLKCKAKDRGYIEKQEIGVTDKEGNDVKLANTTYIFGNSEFIDTFTKNDDSTNEEDTRDTE